jgi:hypothetical protein
VFFPSLVWLRGLAKFAADDAVFVMALCSAHVTDDVIGLLTEARVRDITFAPHTTQIFEVLDLTLFGVLKRRPRYKRPFENENATARRIMTKYHDFKQTMVSPNIWGAFRALGLDF